jgi:hypothetical protein
MQECYVTATAIVREWRGLPERDYSMRVVTASWDKTARLWPVGTWATVAELTDTAIARVPRCLSPEERVQVFLGDETPAWCYALSKFPYGPRRYGFSWATIDVDRAKKARLASRHQFDLPKCQVHRGSAAIYLNVYFGRLSVYFLHFAPKTSHRTIDDPYDLAFAHPPLEHLQQVLADSG